MASQAYPNVYLESMEATGDPGNESNQVRNQTVQGTPVGQCKQRILGSRRKRYNAASGTHMQPSQSRLSLPNGLLCSIAQNVRNRRMPNGTYGGVRGRETKEIGGKLQESFVFLLLDHTFCHNFAKSYRNPSSYEILTSLQHRYELILFYFQIALLSHK